MSFSVFPRVVSIIIIVPVVLSTSEETTSLTGPTRLPNVGYLLSGYNIFKGNPQSSTTPGVDPGFTTDIYQSTFSSQTTSDGRHLVPDHTSIKMNVGCEVSFTSDSTFKQEEYEKSLAISAAADVSGPLYGTASFSASTDYKNFAKRTSSQKLKMISSTAECVVYTGGIHAFTPPNFTDNFNEGMNHLPSEYGTGEDYFDFIDVFGTHVAKEVTMGARFGFTSYLDEQSWKKIEETGISVTAAAKYEGVVKAGGSINNTISRKAQEEFSRSSQHEAQITLGAKPTTTDANEWAKNVIDEPMPIRYKFQTICHVLTGAEQIANCDTALKEYCEKRLKAQSIVASCDAPHDGELTCLWANDCGPDASYRCVNHRCEKDRPRPAEIHNNDVVYLKHVGSGMYFKDVKAASSRKNWPHGRLGDPRGEFQLRLENPAGPIHGDGQTLVRIRSQTTTSEGYDFMYSSEQGGIYFDQDDQSNDKQWWKVAKVSAPDDDDVLRAGDIVRFENKHESTYLQKHEHDYVYALDGKDNWQIQISDKQMFDSPVVV